MKTPYQLTDSDRAFAKAYDSSIGDFDSEVVFDAVKQHHNEKVQSIVSSSIIDAYCVWNCGVEYGKNLPDAGPDEDEVQEEDRPRTYDPLPHPGDGL